MTMMQLVLLSVWSFGSALAPHIANQRTIQTRGANYAEKQRARTTMGLTAKAGLLAPLVELSKNVMGSERLNEVRGEAIKLHSKVISSFVETNELPIGKVFLRQLFALADIDHNGVLDRKEIQNALTVLGFNFLTEDQTDKIFARADVDGNAQIDFSEFVLEAPKTLRTNLIKLAKKNGNELGFLV